MSDFDSAIETIIPLLKRGDRKAIAKRAKVPVRSVYWVFQAIPDGLVSADIIEKVVSAAIDIIKERKSKEKELANKAKNL